MRELSNSGNDIALDPQLVKDLRGPLFGANGDKRFLIFFSISFLINLAIMIYLGTMEISEKEVTIEKIPERLVKILMDKKIDKEKVEIKKEVVKEVAPKKDTPEYKTYAKKEARKNIAKRARKTQKKIQSSQLMKLLVGRGSNSRSSRYAAKDMLAGATAKRVNLDDLLSSSGGMTTDENIATANSRKSISSKDIDAGISSGNKLKDLLSSSGPAINLKKIGKVSFKKPQIVGDVAQTGNRSQKAIQKVIRQNQKRLETVHKRWLKKFPDLAGKVTVRFTILQTGKVFDIVVLENSTNNDGFSNDIVRRIKNWNFGPVEKGELKVTLPFVFQVGA